MDKIKNLESIELTRLEYIFVKKEAKFLFGGNTGKYLSALISNMLRQQNPEHRIFAEQLPNGSTFGKAVEL